MNRVFVVLAILLATISTSFAGAILSEREFTKQYVATVIKMEAAANAEIVDDLEVSITLSNNAEFTSFLDNAYADYKRDPEAIEAILKSYASTVFEAMELKNTAFTKEMIFPVIKNKQYVEQTKALFKDSGNKGIIYEKLTNELYVVYVFDAPQSIRLLTESDLANVDVKKRELRALAKANLKKVMPQIKIAGDPSSLAILIADGNYESSFILFDGFWKKENFPVQGEIVVFIPARDALIITGSQDSEGLAMARQIINENSNQWSHGITDRGLVRSKKGWREYRAK